MLRLEVEKSTGHTEELAKGLDLGLQKFAVVYPKVELFMFLNDL